MTLAAVEAVQAAQAMARGAARDLGGWLHAVILHGSLVLGDYVPGQSLR